MEGVWEGGDGERDLNLDGPGKLFLPFGVRGEALDCLFVSTST